MATMQCGVKLIKEIDGERIVDFLLMHSPGCVF